MAKKILIVEDEIIIAEDIRAILEDLGYEVVGHAINYQEFVNLSGTCDFDVALVDIMLGGAKNGIDVGRYIKEKLKKPFVFVSSYSDRSTLEDAKAIGPSGYVVKPFDKSDLYAAIEIIPAASENSGKEKDLESILEDSVFVKDKDLLKKVEIKNIAWIKSDGNYLEVYDHIGKRFLLRSSLESFLSTLPKYFFRTHRSFAININFIDALNSSYVMIKDAKVPVSKTYRSKLIEYLKVV